MIFIVLRNVSVGITVNSMLFVSSYRDVIMHHIDCEFMRDV